MKEIHLHKIGINSFMKLTGLSSLSLGLIIGIFSLFLSFTKPDQVTFYISENVQFQGFVAGAISLIFIPATAAFIGAGMGLVAYLPFCLVMKIAGKLKLDMDFEEIIEQVDSDRNSTPAT